MQDVWVYGPSKGSATDLNAALAELGFAPHYLGLGQPVIPTPTDGSTARRPSLAALVAGPDEPLPAELFDRINAAEELEDVGLLLVVDTEHLRSFPTLAGTHELLVRPFSLAELEVRVARVTRDVVDSDDDSTVVRAGPLELNLATYQVKIDGNAVGFTYMEYELLKFLMTHPNRVFAREALLKRVWGYDYYGGTRTVDVHIRRVRAKLGQEQANRVKTVRSVGYLFELSARAA